MAGTKVPSLPPIPTLKHLRATNVVNPLSSSVAKAPEVDLEGLWSTEPGDDTTVASEETDLSSLWMGRVAAETGERVSSAMDLESVWMREIRSPRGTTASGVPDEISFDDADIDTELAQYRGVRHEGSSRVQVGQVGRFPVMAEPRPVRAPVSASRTIAEIREAAREQKQVEASKPRISVIDRTAEYASRPTAYQRIMNDD